MKKQKIDMEDYIEKFHALGGATLPEHQKNFSLYMKTLDEAASFDPEEFFKNLHPRNHQEEIFRVKLLQKFNRHSELIEILKSANRILAKVAIKDDNFIREILKRYSVENKFIEELTPFVSYVIRFNLINKLARLVDDEKVAEEFYKKVYEKYGLQPAREFLIRCKLEFVEKIQKNFQLDLSEDELILLHKRSPEMFEEYLKKYSIGCLGLKISTYLAKVSMEELHKFTKYSKVTLGKKYRREYIKAHKSDLIKSPDKFPLSLNSKSIAKILTPDEMIQVFEDNFRSKRHYRFYKEIQYLKHYPKKFRGRILFTSYKNVHGCDLWQNPKNVENDLLEILPVEDRIKFDFIAFYPELLPLPQAISTLKSKINVTSDIWSRAELCVKLLEACTHNDDYKDELLGILKYYSTRHKNDHGSSLSQFLNYLLRNFELETLGKDYWEVIEEMYLLFEVNKEHFYSKPNLLGKFLIYKFSNGIDYGETLIEFFKSASDNISDYSTLVGKYERDCILKLPELLPEIHTKETELNNAKVNYLSVILNYNTRHPKSEQINPYDYYEFWKILLQYFRENQYRFDKLAIDLLETVPQNEEERRKHMDFWEEIRKIGTDDGFTDTFYKWLIRCNPLVVLDNPQKFINRIGNYDVYLGYEIQKFGFLGITQKLDKICLEILEGGSENKTQAINYFSFQSKSVSLLKKLCEKYSPAEEGCKINVREVDKEILDIQTALLDSFKNSPLPSDLIEILLPFCNGDYFKYSLEPLYFIMYHTAEDRIEKAIFELLKRAVSVRKHTVHLAGAVGSIDLKMKVFSMMAKEEKNVSVRKYILKKILKYFFQEKTETSWELLRNNLKLITVDDKESLDQIKDIYKVPKSFLNSYLVAIWDFFSGFNNKSQFEMIYKFHSVLKDPALDSFCRKIITSSLYNPDNNSVRDTQVFTANFLLMGVENMDDRLQFVWDLIQSRAKHEHEKHKILNTFCQEIKIENPSTVHKMLISKILKKFPSLNIRKDLLSLELLLNSTAFYVNWNKQHSALTNFLIEQHDHVTEKCTPHVLHFFADFMGGFVESCFPYPERKLELFKVIKFLLENYDREKYGLLCFLLLRGDYGECADSMREVLHMLQFSTSPALRVYLEKYLIEHPEFENV